MLKTHRKVRHSVNLQQKSNLLKTRQIIIYGFYLNFSFNSNIKLTWKINQITDLKEGANQ